MTEPLTCPDCKIPLTKGKKTIKIKNPFTQIKKELVIWNCPQCGYRKVT